MMINRPMSEIDDILRVFRTLHRLKELPRQGFIYFGFKRDETDSIAEHSFMVTWIAYVLANELKAKAKDIPLFNREDFVPRVVKTALIHDWGEAVAGDLNYRVKEVFRSIALVNTEEKAFKALVDHVPKQQQEELTELWSDYDKKNGIEPAIVKIADALDAWLQGLVTPSTWWPAWEDYSRKTEKSLAGKVSVNLSGLFRRICDIARYPDVQIKLPPSAGNRDDILLDDSDLWKLLRFIKNIYCLKELPRHGFTIFGMKRSETDTFAGHSFTTACLSYLLSMIIPGVVPFKAIMMALIHDLPVSIIGDVSYDLQEFISHSQKSPEDSWGELQKSVVDELTRDLSSGNCIKEFMEEWDQSKVPEAWIVRAAAALDAWEMGVTTPTAWMDAWLDYRKKNLTKFPCEDASGCVHSIREILEKGYQRLAKFVPCELESGLPVGRKPVIELIRL